MALATEVSASSSFVVLSYNILAESLGSNCIPWVMTASANFIRETEAATGQAWAAWKQAHLMQTYAGHFHKNIAIGDYLAMRGLWSARSCKDDSDIPPQLRKSLKVLGEDSLAYTDSSGKECHVETLRGLLRRLLPGDDLGCRLFEHLIELQEEVFDWTVRGPRLFREITRARELKRHPNAEVPPSLPAPPDVFALMEYDAHYVLAGYRSPEKQETFEDAMRAAGYSSILFHDPFQDRPSPSGIGIFWSSSFELASGSDESQDGKLPVDPASGRSFLRCGATYSGGAAQNFDFCEKWHRLGGHGEETMTVADRRNLAVVKLRQKSSGQILWVAACHLMTTSRDCAKTNAFPGEVRASELAAAKRILSQMISANEAVLLLGDFNTDANDFVRVNSGQLTSVVNSDTLSIDTGLVEELSGGERQLLLRWPLAGGCDLHLREVFETYHRWGLGVGPRASGGHCTSLNAQRVEWIDFVWHSQELLRPLAVSDTTSLAEPIPDRTQGSDHIPVAVRFDWACKNMCLC